MLWRLVARLLFKACVPLVAIAGVLTYGVYLRGGDPSAMWSSVVERGLGQFDKLFANVQDDTSRAVGAITRGVNSVAAEHQAGALTQVFTWKDDDGVTHYSTSLPDGVVAGTVMVDPNVNVLAPVRAPVSLSTGDSPGEASTEDSAERLPGVAGQVLATRQPAPADNRTGDALPGVDPTQLLRMLQSAED